MTAIDTPAAGTGSASLIRETAARVAAAGQSSPRQGRDPVNLPLIRNWIEAIGDPSPVYTDSEFAAASVHGALVAPPAMIQVWTMPGLHGGRAGDDPLGQMSQALDAAGYTSVVATNCDQVYHRYLRHGEQVSVRASLLGVTGPKRTALGEGWFVTTRSTWYAGGEAVATMDFRILKFRPQPPSAPTPSAPAPSAPAPSRPAPSGPVMRPQISPDTAFFWAGTAAGELRIQQCGTCGALRHPPGPMCPQCRAPQRGSSGEPGYVVAAGTGEVYSYVVHHHPPVPGKTLPLVIALVELPEGVRVLGDMPGVAPDQVRIGLPVRVAFDRIDDDLTLPVWRPAAASPAAGAVPQQAVPQQAVPQETVPHETVPHETVPHETVPHETVPHETVPHETVPELVIEATPTFVISSALATRDFQDVHHDRDLAVARGSKDIFVNILTTTGLVQRYVSGWAGPQAVFRSISIRLGAPCYAGDTLAFSGQVSGGEGSERVVTVTGRCGLGDHVTGTVRVELPGSQP